VNLGLTLTTPPVSHRGPAQISFTGDGKALVVSIKGNISEPVQVFSFSTTTGVSSTAAAKTPFLGQVAFGFAFADDGTLLLTDAAPYGTDSGVILVNVTTNPITVNFEENAYYTITNQTAACWAAWSAQSNHFYAANSASHSISEISRDQNAVISILSNLQTPNASVTDLLVINIGGTEYLMANEASVHKLLITSLSVGSTSFGGVQYFIDYSSAVTNTSHPAGIAFYTIPATPSPSNTASTPSGPSPSGYSPSGPSPSGPSPTSNTATSLFSSVVSLIAAICLLAMLL